MRRRRRNNNRTVDEDVVEDWRALYQRVGDRGLAELLTDALDARAGDYRLTEHERQLQRACRDRFGIYDPTLQAQADFIDGRLVPAVEDADTCCDCKRRPVKIRKTAECATCYNRRYKRERRQRLAAVAA